MFKSELETVFWAKQEGIDFMRPEIKTCRKYQNQAGHASEDLLTPPTMAQPGQHAQYVIRTAHIQNKR